METACRKRSSIGT